MFLNVNNVSFSFNPGIGGTIGLAPGDNNNLSYVSLYSSFVCKFLIVNGFIFWIYTYDFT